MDLCLGSICCSAVEGEVPAEPQIEESCDSESLCQGKPFIHLYCSPGHVLSSNIFYIHSSEPETILSLKEHLIMPDIFGFHNW